MLSTTAHAAGENCHVRVAWLEGAKKQSIVFATRLENAEQCRRLARLHQPNFEPERMHGKKVGYHFGPKRTRNFSKL